MRNVKFRCVFTFSIADAKKILNHSKFYIVYNGSIYNASRIENM